ncbi:hypothetical protein HOLleu_40887 [Holothuria leucospilota]|uniref:Uncharacterized protein n=1 Tax=Holothuria leucospilota TaxID=206669 RepID=A0A9Q0YDZ8_HOLLE|nr:hypothetical protein HOLleu_40887 [Holothuria leucospilota]
MKKSVVYRADVTSKGSTRTYTGIMGGEGVGTSKGIIITLNLSATKNIRIKPSCQNTFGILVKLNLES